MILGRAMVSRSPQLALLRGLGAAGWLPSVSWLLNA